MNWHYAYNPAIWPSIFTIMLLTVVAVYAWRRRSLPGTTALTCFVLEYTWPGRRATRRTVALVSLVPLLAVGLLFTNNFHHQ